MRPIICSTDDWAIVSIAISYHIKHIYPCPILCLEPQIAGKEMKKCHRNQ